MNTNLHETGHLEDVELVLDINYMGNFHVSIDADMVLGKKGFLSIKGTFKATQNIQMKSILNIEFLF